MNLGFKITCKGLGIVSVIKDESLSLKLLVILSRAVQSIIKRSEKVTKIYGLNPTEFAVLELYYAVKVISLYKNLERSSITYASNISEGIELMDTIFPQHKEGFGKYLVVWTILRKNDN